MYERKRSHAPNGGRDGYATPYGYVGFFNGRYRLFPTEQEYEEMRAEYANEQGQDVS